VVLFPAAPLPLHSFEPRYRTMLADCLAADRRFGITPRDRGEPEEPPPGAVGSVARIIECRALPDGRSNIMALGESRFRYLGPVPTGRPYRVGTIEEFGDEPATTPDPHALAQLEELAGRLRQVRQTERDPSSTPLTPAVADPERISFQAAALLDLPVTTGLHLLSLRSTAARVVELLELLNQQVAAAAAGLEVQRSARSNGNGQHGRELPSSQ
jgi:Lon protease-like protein